MKDEKPKLQNTPVRTEEGRELRRADYGAHQQPVHEADSSELRRALGAVEPPVDGEVIGRDVVAREIGEAVHRQIAERLQAAVPYQADPVEGEVIGRDEVPQGCGQCPACLANAARRDARARAGGIDGVVLLVGPPSRGGGLLELLLGLAGVGGMQVVDADPPNEDRIGRPARGLPPGDYLAAIEPADLEPVIRRFEPPAPPDPEDDRKRVRGPNLSRREMLARQRQHGGGKRGR